MIPVIPAQGITLSFFLKNHNEKHPCQNRSPPNNNGLIQSLGSGPAQRAIVVSIWMCFYLERRFPPSVPANPSLKCLPLHHLHDEHFLQIIRRIKSIWSIICIVNLPAFISIHYHPGAGSRTFSHPSAAIEHPWFIWLSIISTTTWPLNVSRQWAWVVFYII